MKKWISFSAVSLVFLYFLIHLFYGSRGFFIYSTLKIDVDHLRNDLTILKIEEKNLNHRVSLLRPKSFDLDLLEEYIHKKLGFLDQREYILNTDNL
jgi:hypothetical protein